MNTRAFEHQLAIKHCTKLLEDFDRDGYDLWWKVPSFFSTETEYLISQGVLVRNEKGQVAWRQRLDDEGDEKEYVNELR